MTDESVTGSTPDAIHRLPSGTLVIFRDYDHVDRRALAHECFRLCRAEDKLFFVAGSLSLAFETKADGYHIPGYQLTDWQPQDFKGLPVSAACHSIRDVSDMERLSVDLALVSPIFVTESHHGATPLGIEGFKTIAEKLTMPVAALGGISADTAPKLAALHAELDIAAVAGIRGLFSLGSEST